MPSRVSPGQPWRPPRAQDQNAWSESAEQYIRERTAVGVQEKPRVLRHDRCKLKNLTNEDQRAGSVLQIGDLIVSMRRDWYWFRGLKPTGKVIPFGVAVDAIKEDKIGDFATVGNVMGRVDVKDTGHRRCEITPGQTYFTSIEVGGDAWILNHPQMQGLQDCQLLLKPISVSGQQIILFKITSVNVAGCKVVADVLGEPCDASGVDEEAGGAVTIYDAMCCLFNEPSVDLVGRLGWATRIKLRSTYAECCAGTTPNEMCIWAAISLCCPTC